MENLGTALIVTLIGMGVIFIVLGILEFLINVLNRLFPYVAPPPATGKKKQRHSAPGVDEETVAVIQAALAKRLSRDPGRLVIKKAG